MYLYIDLADVLQKLGEQLSPEETDVSINKA